MLFVFIRVIRVPIDLGGGADSGAGGNILRGNGDYDLRIDIAGADTDIIYARNNFWDHVTHADISTFDIFDRQDIDSLPRVDFTPFAVSSAVYSDLERLPNHIAVTPNPATTGVTIVYRLAHRSRAILRLVDATGTEQMRLVDEIQNEGTHRASIDRPSMLTGAFANGLYFMVLNDGTSATAVPIIFY